MKPMLAALGALCAFVSIPAAAAVYDFSVVSAVQIIPGDYSYVPNYQFSIDDANVFQANAFTYEADNVETFSQRPVLGSPGGDEVTSPNYRFYTGDLQDYGGGFDDEGSHSYFSNQLFTEAGGFAFAPGTYDLYYDPANPTADATLTISKAGAPGAPAPLLGLGGLPALAGAGALAALRTRRRRAPKAA